MLALYHFLSPSKPASPRHQLNKGVSQALLRVNCPLKPLGSDVGPRFQMNHQTC